MPVRCRSVGRRSKMQVSADRAADELVGRLGRMVREARLRLGLTQDEVASRAGVHQSTISVIERGGGSACTMRVWVRAALAVDSDLRAYLEGISAADRPRDHVHLRGQELILVSAAPGGWSGVAEAEVDHDRSRSRSADVLLCRRTDQAMVEVWDWFHDVGGAWRTSTSKVARSAPDGPDGRVGLLWVVRATRRNRQLIE